MAYFGWLSGQVARNSEPYMRQVFVASDITDENQLARQVRLPRGSRQGLSMNSQREHQLANSNSRK